MSSPNDDQQPVDRDNLDRGPLVMAITWIFLIIALIFVATRLASETSFIEALPTLNTAAPQIIQLAIQSLVTNSYTYGLDKHDHSLYQEEMITMLRNSWVSVPPGIVVGLLSRASIAIMLSRIFKTYKWFTYYLISFTALTWVAWIVQIPISFLQVKPVEALWNFTLVPERRWDLRVWLYTAYFAQSCFTVSDLTYALFPVILTWRLNMPVRERISLIIVMCGSVLSMSMSILKTIAMGAVANSTVGAPDVQYQSSLSLLYGYIEQCVVIIIGCIPTLRSVIKKLDFSKLSELRYYMYTRKASVPDLAFNRYTNLDTDHYKLTAVTWEVESSGPRAM
ncbi:uncharacterized protein F4812DRAFT_468525 [Daldinia caldariorum]|uniref:uncharacterized protein n=1 Tax=Daldinia caldariorum TaxID=326644 RepID=UPI00200720DA|nr:uncharacterized protein F4812DRAFT_468525 [Daldinia caldariorum]KAI1463633.1 hypothetical protein F4812DRAFT_468525 [Daldinia caldariorum]